MKRSTETITTKDHWKLTTEILLPTNPKGVLVMGHAMMANRRSLDKPKGNGFASCVANEGIVVVLPDLRGHGESGPYAAEGGSWFYDDLVEFDAPALLQFARERFPSLPVAMGGHSLFGHVSSAMAGTVSSPPEALLLVAVNVWISTIEVNRARWLTKRATMESLLFAFRKIGYCPSRTLKFGSDDEPLPYFEQFLTWVRTGIWQSRNGENYLQNLSKYHGKVLSISGAGDSINCHPSCAFRFAEHFSGTVDHRCVGKESGLLFDPGHMQLMTDARSRPVWEMAASWLAQTFQKM